MRHPLAAVCAAAALLPLAACVRMSTLAEPVSLKVVRSAAVQPVADMKTDATILHSPIGMMLHSEAKKALQWDKIEWTKQDVLVVRLDHPGRALGDLRIKGYTLFVPLATAEADSAGANASCLVAVVEKTRATEVVVEAQ